MRYSLSRLTLVATTVLFSAFAVQGEDFLISGSSARSVAVGGTYVPSDSALDAMAQNPAGLTRLSAPKVEFNIETMFARGEFTNSANTNAPLNANGVVPYGAFGTPLGKSRLSLGFAVLPELMSAARWRYTDAPGGVGGVSYGILNNNSEILAVRSAFGMGVSLGKYLQVGATVGAVYNSNTLQTAYVFQNHPALAGLKTSLDLNTNGVGWNSTFGAIVRPSKKFEFGVTYKSKTTIESRGLATGNAGVQFAAIGLGAARPDFRYDAEVDNTLPQSVVANFAWQSSRKLRLVAQADWVNWADAFVNLPVNLTNGNNADINGLLGTNGIKDSIPLSWKNQIVGRVGVERSWTENTQIRFGYAHSNSVVPGSTLSPLTANITRNTISAGLGYQHGRYRFDLGYTIDPTTQATSGTSIIKAGEYDNSTVRVGVQRLVLTTSIRL